MRRTQSKFIWRFLVSHLLILIVPMLVFGFGFYKTSQIVKHDVLEANLKSLEQAQHSIDQSIKEIDDLVISVSTNPSLQWLMTRNTPLETKDYARLYDSSKNVETLYNLSSVLVLRYYIIYPNSGIVISPAGTYNLDNFYGYAYSIPGTSQQEWEESYLTDYKIEQYRPSQPTVVEGNTFETITYLRSIPVTQYGEPQAFVLVLIDTQQLLKPLQSLRIEGGNAIVADSENNTLASLYPMTQTFSLDGEEGYKEYKVEGEEYLVSWLVSPQNGFHYIAQSRSSLVMGKLNSVQRSVILVSTLCLLAGIGIAWALSYANAKPFERILQVVKGAWGTAQESSDEYKFLEASLSELVENDAKLRERVRSNLPMAQSNFIGQLLRGEILDPQEISTIAQQLDLTLAGDFYNVVTLQLGIYVEQKTPQTLNELNTIKILIKSFWEDFWGEEMLSYSWDLDEQSLAFITVHSTKNPEKCLREQKEVLELFQQSIYNEFGLPVAVASGKGCHEIVDIYYVFSALQYQAEQEHRPESHGITAEESHTSDFEMEQWMYYYPVDLEQRLINIVRTSNMEELEKLLEIIYQENMVEQELSVDMSDNLFLEIRGTVYKIYKQLGISENEQIYYISQQMKAMKNRKDSDERFAVTEELLRYLCNIAEGNKVESKDRTLQQMEEYIQANFHDSNLGLYSIATYFNFSEANFSYFFKENFGENFSVYLERLRIDTACHLIRTTEYSFEEIAEQIGYNSAGTFRRAFKRAKGILPSEYKHMTLANVADTEQ